MCGIGGVWNFDLREQSKARGRTAKILETLRHRGPDSCNLTECGSSGLVIGCCRLAITDSKNPQADMPISSNDGKIILALNGEIYNHLHLRSLITDYQFKTSSDSETCLAAYQCWGQSFFERLEGMFAIAVFDSNLQSLFLARDFTGQKPIYYNHSAEGFAFSSELLPLLKTSPNRLQLDRAALIEFIENRFIIGEDTHVEEIKKVLPGHVMSISESGVASRCFALIDIPAIRTADPARAQQEMERSLDIASKATFANLEHKAGLLLSGGIDSAIVLAQACKLGVELETFSLGFEHADGPSYERSTMFDEFQYSDRLADIFKTNHHKIILGPKEYFKLFSESALAIGEPLGVNELPCLARLFQEASKDCKIVYSGCGPDEMLDGYEYGHSLKADSACTPFNISKQYFSQFKRVFLTDIRRLLQGNDAENRVINKIDYALRPYRNLNLDVQSLTQIIMFSGRLVSYEFRQLDYSSMRWGVEARSPLAHEVFVRTAFSLSSEVKRHQEQTKWPLKAAAIKLLPPEIIWREKGSFPVPPQYFFSPIFQNLLEDMFAGDSILRQMHLLDFNYLDVLLKSFEPGNRPIFIRLLHLHILLQSQKEHLYV